MTNNIEVLQGLVSAERREIGAPQTTRAERIAALEAALAAMGGEGECNHVPYLGACIHCGCGFREGQAVNSPAQPEAQGEAVAWQAQLADALEAFWNPAVGAIQDASYHGPASGSDVVGAIAQGLAAVAGALREQQTAAPKVAGGVTDAMVERAAQAMAFINFDLDAGRPERSWAEADAGRKAEYRRLARAALAAAQQQEADRG